MLTFISDSVPLQTNMNFKLALMGWILRRGHQVNCHAGLQQFRAEMSGLHGVI